MKHYPVAVITNNGTKDEITAALAPYHKFESTDIVDEYVQLIDITKEVKKEVKEAQRVEDEKSSYALACQEVDGENPYLGFIPFSYKGSFSGYVQSHPVYKNYPILGSREILDLIGKHKYGWVEVGNNGRVAKITQRRNPNGKWKTWKMSRTCFNILLTKSGTPTTSAQYSSLKKDLLDKLDFFAVVKDGQWHHSLAEPKQRAALLFTVEPTQWITVVDCCI